MAYNADHYRESAQQCCLNAVVAQDISSIHWLEAVEYGRQAGVIPSANGLAMREKPYGDDN